MFGELNRGETYSAWKAPEENSAQDRLAAVDFSRAVTTFSEAELDEQRGKVDLLIDSINQSEAPVLSMDDFNKLKQRKLELREESARRNRE